jgi:hypothetical protein
LGIGLALLLVVLVASVFLWNRYITEPEATYRAELPQKLAEAEAEGILVDREAFEEFLGPEP